MILEASTVKREHGPRLIADWLDLNYTVESTKEGYYCALINWVRCIYGRESVSEYIGHRWGINPIRKKRDSKKRINEIEEGVERYFSDLDDRDFLTDYKRFIPYLRDEGYAGLTIRNRLVKIKIYFERDPRCKIEKDVWRGLSRTLMPKSTRASTQDDILTKEQLKMVLKYMSFHGKALALFLVSSGVRRGAACQIEMEDIHLYADPPWVNIRNEITKGEVGGRIIWFSEEARDAIIQWHKIREKTKKQARFGGEYNKKLVFNYEPKHFTAYWNKMLEKADEGADPPVLAKRDTSTKKEHHVYHIHTLRKFFRTNMGLEGSYKGKSGIPDMIIHAWMGHQSYLNQYDKLGRRQMAEIYKDNMHVVTVHEVALGEKAKAKYRKTEEEAKILRIQTKTLEDQAKFDASFIAHMGGQLNIPEIAHVQDLELKKEMIIEYIENLIGIKEEFEAHKKYESKTKYEKIDELIEAIKQIQ